MTEQRVQAVVPAPAATEPSAPPVFWHEAAALQQAIQQPLRDPTDAYLGGLRETSRAAVRKRLRSVARLIGVDAAAMPWHELRFVHIEFIRQKMIDAEAAPATINATLSALRGIARYARNLNLLSAEEYTRICDVKPAGGTRLPAGREVKRGELAALVEACAADPSPAGRRDAAILAVLYAGGLRRAEAAALLLGDYAADPPTLTVRHGKGDKQRQVPLPASAAAAVARWIAVRGKAPGRLFLPINKGHRIADDLLTAHALYKVLQKRAAQARVARLSPHDLRRAFVSDLLDANVDASTVQQLAGHANVTTTLRYDRRGEETKRRAVEHLHFPLSPDGDKAGR